MSVVVTLVAFVLLCLKSSVLFAQTDGECEGESCASKKPTVVWLRPPELGIEGSGVSITSGPIYDVMAYLSTHLHNYDHQFEAYPVKRAWSMVQHQQSAQKVYCFYGAAYQEERAEWGYYSQPTSINLPLLIVARKALQPSLKNELDTAQSQPTQGYFESISLRALLQHNLRTVLYNDVNNVYADTVEQWATKNNVVRLNGLGKDLGMHTIALLESGRIDFGYVGHRELSALPEEELDALNVYQISELSQQLRGTKRLLCSKSELGQAVTSDLDSALTHITSTPMKSQILRDINFVADGYPLFLKPLFDERWSKVMLNESCDSATHLELNKNL